MTWPKRQLREFIVIKHGFAFSSRDFGDRGKYVVLTPGHFFEEGGFRPQPGKERFLTKEPPPEYVLPKGALIVAMTEQGPGLLGSCAVIPEAGCYLHNQRLGLVEIQRPDEIRPEFVYYTLNSRPVRKQIHQSAGGMKVRHTSPDKIRAAWFALPPPGIQEKIGRVLAALDGMLDSIRKELAAKKAFKRGLMQRLLTGQRRFPEFRDVPWCEIHLGDVFAERNETNRRDLPLLSVTGHRGIIPRDELDKRDTSNPDKSKYKRVMVGDIAYNTMRMWQGVSALSALEGIVSPAYTVAVPTNRIHGPFARHLFKHAPVVHLFHRHSQGLVDDTLNLKFDKFARIKLTIPSDTAEQARIARVLDLCDSEIDLLAAKQEQVENYHRALLSHLLSGDLPV